MGLKCNTIIESLNYHRKTTFPGLAGKRVWILISKKSCIKKVDQYFRKKNNNNIILKKYFGGTNLLIYYQI